MPVTTEPSGATAEQIRVASSSTGRGLGGIATVYRHADHSGTGDSPGLGPSEVSTCSVGMPGRGSGFESYRRLAMRVTQATVAGISFAPNGERGETIWPDFAPEGANPVELLAIERLAQTVISRGTPLAISDIRAREEARGQRSIGTGFNAFLGAPLFTETGSCLACLYTVDRRARHWTEDELESLADLARLASAELTLRLGVNEQRDLENMLRMLDKAVENMQLGVTVTDMSGKIVYTNPAEARMHGFETNELIGKHARLLGPPEATRELDARNARHAASWTRETVNVRRDGTRFPVLLWSDVVTDSAGRKIGIVTCSEDITERKRAEQALKDFAVRDHLTGLPNRAHFLDRLTRAIEVRRKDARDRFAVLFLDLDRFKVVNDSLGHHVGDELLTVVSNRLLGCLGTSGTVARFGGDEFAILLEGISGVEDAVRVAQKVQTSLGGAIHLHGYELFTSASIGIVMNALVAEQPEYLWRSADMAMYRAKSRGAGHFEIFDRTMHADALARLELETDLRRAIERNELRLEYQPVIDLKSGYAVGCEALLRWDHPRRGPISPTEVIPIAEETGMIVKLGEWVLLEGCRQLKCWQSELGDKAPRWVGVNLSSKQLSQPNLIEVIETVVGTTGIEPQMLKLEITESGVIENSEVATRTLGRLKEIGVQLFMDDFGTGYSSLSYLHRLPLDALKIDRSFVSQMVKGDRHSRLVDTIVQLARGVRLPVVAEGVSTPEQLEMLRELGCDLAQGFLFSKPLPPAEMTRFMERFECFV